MKTLGMGIKVRVGPLEIIAVTYMPRGGNLIIKIMIAMALESDFYFKIYKNNILYFLTSRKTI